jgi:two-component system cell cycle response regulator
MGTNDRRDSLSSSGLIAKPGAVLVVDDDESLRMLVVKWLSKSGMACVEARSGEEAIERAIEMADGLDAIVCDVMMPGLDGFAVLERLKANASTALIPVVLLTAHANTEGEIVRGAEVGAADHIAKPFSGPILVAKVKAIVARSQSEKTLRNKLVFAEKHATIDALTGLFNRRHFESRLRGESSNARRHRRPLSLVLIDLDHFKSVNDTFGHEEGDNVLVRSAAAIRALLRSEDAAFRYGGEEFVVLLRDCDAESAAIVGNRLRAYLQGNPMELGPSRVSRTLTFSGGIAAATAKNSFDTDELVARADEALYRAKRGGRDRIELEMGDAKSEP